MKAHQLTTVLLSAHVVAFIVAVMTSSPSRVRAVKLSKIKEEQTRERTVVWLPGCFSLLM